MFLQYQNGIQATIDNLQNQIAQLQRQLSEVQAHQQAALSVEQAAISAIEQVRAALAMIQQVAPELQAEFQSEVMAVFEDYPELPPTPPADEPDTIVNPGPVPDQTIDVEAISDRAIVGESIVAVKVPETKPKRSRKKKPTVPDVIRQEAA